MTDNRLLRSDRAALISALKDAGATKFSGNACCCPFHEDRTPSGGVYNRDGVWRFKCQACGEGGDVFDIRAKAKGTTPADELRKVPKATRQNPPANRPGRKSGFASMDTVRQYLVSKVGRIESEYTYTDANGEYVQTVFRCRTAEGKTFRPVHLTDEGYVLRAGAKPWSLYRLSEIVKADRVIIIAEGEACVSCLGKYGFAATTSMDGSKSARHSDWSALAGTPVCIWPDYDTEGQRYLAEVEGILDSLHPSPRVSVIDPAAIDLCPGEDVVDFVRQLQVLGKTDAEITAGIDAALKTAKVRSVAGEVRQRIADIAAGRYAAIPMYWTLLSSLTQAMLPGSVTLLAGSGGATKSFMALQMFVAWMLNSLRVALWELEEDQISHLMRALAQRSGHPGLTDTTWVKDNFELADSVTVEHSDFLDNLRRVVHTTPDQQVTLGQVAEWAEDQAKRGSRVIGVDPITAAARVGDVWTADASFVQAIKRTATDYGVSILLVTHPVKNVQYPDLTQIAGAACYHRFCQTILWLEMHEPKFSRIRTAGGTSDVEHNRTVYVLKARNGRGGGFRLAFQFEPENLTLSELGVILPKKKGGSA